MSNLTVDKTKVSGIEQAIRGARNPMNSHHLSDSVGDTIGVKDLELAQKLIVAGSEHCKFMRQIQVWVDISTTRYVWQELDTYKFNTKNSTSTMHRLFNTKEELTIDSFYAEDLNEKDYNKLLNDIKYLNDIRQEWLDNGKKFEYVARAKKLFPESYIQLRTVNTNYAELRNIYFQRRNHRLKKEWGTIIKWIESLPYAKELIIYEKPVYKEQSKDMVYISGKISGLDEEVYLKEFSAIENRLIQIGYKVINPAKELKPLADKLKQEGVSEIELWDILMREAIKLLLKCNKICLLHNWNESAGSNLEVEIANGLDYSFIYSSSLE